MKMSSLNKAKIMVVDDELRVRELLSRKLADEGYQCPQHLMATAH